MAGSLLRGHALVDDDGVVRRTSLFGRTLVHGGVELRRRVARAWGATLESAAFVDAAAAWRGAPDPEGESAAAALAEEGTVHVDPGVGIRIDLPGTPGLVRLDVARALRGGLWRWSAGWRIPWSSLRRGWDPTPTLP